MFLFYHNQRDFIVIIAMSKKIYIKTYGCQMNVHDSEKIVEIMRLACNMELIKSPEQADLILLNTCSIREKAKEKIFSDLGKLRDLKNRRPSLVIGVGGCVASQEGVKIRKRAPCVDLVFGPQTIHKLPEMYQQFLQTHKPIIAIEFLAADKFAQLPKAQTVRVSAFVSIMEGCNKYCSYCIVPFTRGKEVSKPWAAVIEECRQLAQQGTKEVVFLGQNVNDYKGIMLDGSSSDLANLISAVAKETTIERIRFYTSYPTSFGDELIATYATEPKLANHLHLPIQSGSDRLLEVMRRRYTVQEFKDKLYKLREVRPNIAITSDFIVGFPGETDDDFQATMDLVKQMKFDISYSFIYSPRPGTLAAKMPDTVSLVEKKQRLAILQEQLNKQAEDLGKAMIGKGVKVLVAGSSKKGASQLTGRAENNRIVNFDGPISLVGQMVDVVITESLTNCLRGRLR
jgi:tRNA-2-methylthio-N6-dimethylallyladenosine synthase